MAGFHGTPFLLGIQHLDVGSRDLIHRGAVLRHGKLLWADQTLDDATVRLMGAELGVDPDGTDRSR